ncbi:PAS domain-containing protein [Pontibacter silvestris]|uniref:histidine kinase n=1 Tax=Pontibacter silvestris TaxID=2305183 RepID=A0ABW4X1L0_9BACT|nr:PAS domain-containing protein [Pontibacter silvestris]MCC9136047.1 PAS domain-containing protein [Pontibacter silvestris]
MDFQKLFSEVPETIVVLSPDYTVLAATDAYLRVSLQTREDLIGMNFLEAFPDNPGSTVSKNEYLLRKSLDNALYGKKVDYLDVLQYDIPKPKSQGGGFEIRYWEASHTPVLDNEGNVLYIFQKTSDVTERELAKKALSESEDKFRFMAEAMPLLIHTNNYKGEANYFNQRWVNYTGKEVKELIETGWGELIHPNDLTNALERWHEAFKNGIMFQAEMRIKDKEGNYRWHLGRGMPMLDEEGKVLMWVGSSIDIHDTRQMVEELLMVNEQMSHLSDQVQEAYRKAESERKVLERLIMQAPAVFCILQGPKHLYQLVNPYYQNLFPNRELLHKTVAEALPEVVEQGFIDILDNVYQSGEAFIAEEILIKLDRKGSGELEDVYFDLIYQPLYEDDKITGIIVFGAEVTEQVSYRRKLEELGNL